MAANPTRVTFTEFNLRRAPGSLLIRVDDEFVRQMERHLSKLQDPAQLPVGGILIGTTITQGREIITISGFAREAAFRSAVKAIAGDSQGRGIVGLYRVSVGTTDTLEREDEDWYGWLFPGEDRLLLKIHPGFEGIPTAVVYVGRNGSLDRERRTVEFPLDLRELGAESAEPATSAPPNVTSANGPERQRLAPVLRIAAVRDVAAETASSPAPALITESLDSPRSRFKIFALVGLVILGVAGAALIGRRQDPVRPTAPAATSQAPNTVPATPPPASAVPDTTSPPATSKRGEEPKSKQTPVAAAQPAKSPDAPAPVTSGSRPAPRPFVMEPRRAAQTSTAVIDLPAPAAPSSGPSSFPIGLSPVQASNPVPPPKPESPPAVQAPAQVQPTPAPASVAAAFTPPRALRPVTPSVPPAALRALPGEVVIGIRVDVDKTGAVLKATPLETTSPAVKFIATHIAAAVKKWQFEPARLGDEAVIGQTVLHFRYMQLR